jgi:hypothetical protein
MTALKQTPLPIPADIWTVWPVWPDLREVLLGLPASNAEVVPYARDQARNCGLPVEAWRRALTRLTEYGLAHHVRLRDLDTGAPRGSSYTRTSAGDKLAAELEGGAG